MQINKQIFMFAYFTLVFLRRLWHVLYLCLLLLVLVQAIIYSKTYFPEYRVTLGRLTIVSYLYILKFYVQHTYINIIYTNIFIYKKPKNSCNSRQNSQLVKIK